MGQSRAVFAQWRAMPGGVRVFLLYAVVLLAFLGVMLPVIVAQAVEMPFSGIGVVWMLLLAYLVFTLTLVLQRKQAAWALALGLATLTVPLVPLLAAVAALPGALVGVVIVAGLFGSLLRASTRGWFVEP